MRSADESCRIQSNLMNKEELRSFNFLKLKYRRGGGGRGGEGGDQIPQLFVTDFRQFLMNSLTPPGSN